MPTKQEYLAQLKAEIARGEGAHKIHVVDHVREKKRKASNLEQSSRLFINCYSPDGWKALASQKDRYFEIARDPRIAVDMMAHFLAAATDEALRAWVDAGHTMPGDREQEPGQPQNLPPWLR